MFSFCTIVVHTVQNTLVHVWLADCTERVCSCQFVSRYGQRRMASKNKQIILTKLHSDYYFFCEKCITYISVFMYVYIFYTEKVSSVFRTKFSYRYYIQQVRQMREHTRNLQNIGICESLVPKCKRNYFRNSIFDLFS